MSQTWLITGCSSGFGLSLARHILSRGHKVIATSRNPSRTPALVKEIEASPHGRWLTLDVTWPAEKVQTFVQGAVKEFGSIDYLVNNAGYSILGAAEEIPEEGARQQFEVNFWGLVRLTQAVLPLMRKAKSGTIINITSIAGLHAQPTCAIYAASKFAVEGWSESLSREVAEHGLRVLIVEPGAFKTNFLSQGSIQVVETGEAYRNGPVQQVLNRFAELEDKQAGDPDKAAKVIFEVATGQGVGHGKTDLLRLPLGKDCFSRAQEAFRARSDNLEAMKDAASSTDFDA